MLIREPVVAPSPSVCHANLVIVCEAILGSSSKGIEQFFGTINRYISEQNSPEKTLTLCTSLRQKRSPGPAEYQLDPAATYWLLDALSVKDLLISLVLTIKYGVTFAFLAMRKASKNKNDPASMVVLSLVVRNNRLDRVFVNLCCYHAARRALKTCRPSVGDLQYEEKPLERAIIWACREVDAQVGGGGSRRLFSHL